MIDGRLAVATKDNQSLYHMVGYSFVMSNGLWSVGVGGCGCRALFVCEAQAL